MQTVKWNGQPLHEATKAEVEEVTNVSYTLKVDYPITDTEIYKKFQEDMLIIAPTPITGRQLFRIKEISEQDDTVNLTCQHITEDIFKRSVRPIKVSNSTCQIALNAMISAVKTPLGKFSFTSNIMDNRTFNTTEDETLYKILMDGKHSIVGAWEGEMIRDNFLIDIPKSRGIDRGVVITTHQNLKQYERNKSSSSIITRLHLKSTFKPEGAEEDTVLKVTVDSPLIGNYPYINEAEYENNDLTTEEELRKWGEAKFKNGDIDKSTDQIKVEAYELDGQTVHLGDTVTIMSLKHDVMLKKKAVGYVFDALSEEYISLTFDDKAGHGGGMSGSNGISDVASEILDTVQKTQEDDEYYKKLKVLVDNANRAFEDKAGALKQEITDGIEEAKAQAEVVKEEISAQVTEKINAANQKNKTEIVEEFKAQYNGIEVTMEGLKTTTEKLIEKDVEVKELVDKFKQSTESQFTDLKGAQSRFEQTTEKAISDLTNVTAGKADRSYVEQTVNGIKEEFTSLKVGSRNYAEDYDFTRGLWFFAHGDSSDSTGTSENGVYTITGNTNTWKQAQLFSSTAPSWATSKTTALDYLEKGEPYTLSFYAKRNSGSGTMWASLRENRKAGDNPERIYAQFQLTDEWKLYKVSVPALKKSDEFDFWRIIIGYSEAGSISFKKVELTQSTTRTDAGPAPEDQEAIITNASASFERTAKGLKTQITALEQYTAESGILESRLKRYTEEQTSNTLKTIRENLSENYISKNKYTEDSEGITRRIEALGSQIDQENLVRLSETLKEYTVSNNNNNNNNRFSRPEDGIFKMKISGSPSYTWLGPCFPLYIDKIAKGETYSVGFEYMIKSGVEVDKGLVFTLKKHSNNQGIFGQTFADKNTPKDRWLKAEFHFTADRDFEFDKSGNFPFYIYAVNNGEFWIQKPMLVKGGKLPPYRPNSLDSINLRIESKLAEYKQTVDGQFSTFSTEFGNNLRYATEGLNNKLATQEQALTTKIANQAQETDSKLQAQADETNQKLSSQNSVLNDKLDDFKESINGRFANYQQTVDGQVATIVSQFDGVLKKTDINITDGQISFGTGKSINGRTISSLLVQEPEAIALIAQLIKVKGDMVVDGSITSRHLASQSVRTGHMESGSVTTQILASNAVTADKLLVDSAMINKFVSNQAFIRELISQQAFITELNSIKIAAERIQGGRLSANNGATVFDLDNGTINLFSNTGTIRRIDDTSSSQFIKFNQVGLIGEYLRDNKAARIVIGTNQDKTENTENGTFAGMRLWSGAKNDVKESLYELVGDRIIFYANGQYRSPWIIHNNTKDGNSYLIPMNEKGVKHNLGRGDKHFSKAYIDDLFIGKGSQNVGGYLWDILTCFGILARYGWDLKNGAVQNHIKSNLINKYGFK
ncbi:gp58-like family protein [Streptococcus parasanguinis]|nr:gp58-like family protein [Streptococcus parasanguinis]